MVRYVGRFSGREYNGRALGDADYRPQLGSWQDRILPRIQQILVDNAAYLPLRPRAILYRLMGMRLATKADAEKVNNLVIAARRAGLIAWDNIDDGRTVVYDFGGYEDPANFWADTRRRVQRQYRRHLRQGQEWWIEIYVESAGYLPVLERTAANYGALVISGSGFNPVPRLRQTAMEAHERFAEDNTRTCVLFLGDLDWSGVTRIDRADADIRQFFIDGLGEEDIEVGDSVVTRRQLCEHIIHSEWIGLTHEQAVELHLLDENGDEARQDVEGKFELEAVQPGDVVQWVVDACERYTDMDVLDELKETAIEERTQMSETIDALIAEWGEAS